jgi:Uma2 family endonuclease
MAQIAHDIIVMNARRILGNQLLDKPCRPRSADIAIAIPAGNIIRYPDLSVDCGTPNDSIPTLVIEVASKRSKDFESIDKLEDYKSIATMKYVLLVSADRPRVRFFYRNESGWESRAIMGMESRIEIAEIGSICLGDLYHGLKFDNDLD